MAPATVGAKSTTNVQYAPTASVPAALEAPNCGQVLALSNVKPAATLGFTPVVGVGNARAALPMFDTVIVCGPSDESVEPTFVAVWNVWRGLDIFENSGSTNRRSPTLSTS